MARVMDTSSRFDAAAHGCPNALPPAAIRRVWYFNQQGTPPPGAGHEAFAGWLVALFEEPCIHEDCRSARVSGGCGRSSAHAQGNTVWAVLGVIDEVFSATELLETAVEERDCPPGWAEKDNNAKGTYLRTMATYCTSACTYSYEYKAGCSLLYLCKAVRVRIPGSLLVR